MEKEKQQLVLQQTSHGNQQFCTVRGKVQMIKLKPQY
jgi:hypothetical protein